MCSRDLDRPSGEEKAVRFFGAEEMTPELLLRAVVLPRVFPVERAGPRGEPG